MTEPPVAPDDTPIPQDGVHLIAVERERQKSVEGWTPDHDDAHRDGELAAAAACYLKARNAETECPRPYWPFERSWWKPADRIRNLIRAGALIAAEIDRLQRALEAEDADV